MRPTHIIKGKREKDKDTKIQVRVLVHTHTHTHILLILFLWRTMINAMIFWKRENHGDSKNISGCKELGGEGRGAGEKVKHKRFLRQ